MVDTAKWEWREGAAAAATAASPLDYTVPLRSTRAQNGYGGGGAAGTQNYKLSCELSKESLRVPGAIPFMWERIPGIPAPPKPTLAALFKLQSPAPSVVNVPVSTAAASSGKPAGSVAADDAHDDADSCCSSHATSDAITATAGALSTFDDSHSFACSAATAQIPPAAQDAKDSIMYRFLPAAQAIAGDSPATGNGPPRRVTQNLPNVNPPSPATAPAVAPPRRPISIQHMSVLGSDDDTDDFSSDHNPPSSARSCSSSLLSFIRIRNAFNYPTSGNHRRSNVGSGGAADLRSGNNGQHQLRRSSSRGSSASAKIGGFMSSPRRIAYISCKGLCSDSSDDVCITAISSPLPQPSRVKDVLNDGVVFQHPPKPLIQNLDISDTSSCCSAYDTPTTFCNSPAAPPYSTCPSVKSAYSTASAGGTGVGTASETSSTIREPVVIRHSSDSINNILPNIPPQLSPNDAQFSPNRSEASPNHNIINGPVIMNLNELRLPKPPQINIMSRGASESPNNNNNSFLWSRINGVSSATSPTSTASINSGINSNGRGAATEVIYCSDSHQSSINGNHLAAPPLPKSPTQSWLHGRAAAANTVNMGGAVRSPSRFSQMHRAASGAPSPLAIVKPPMVLNQSPSHNPPAEAAAAAAVSASEQILQQQQEERLDSSWEALVKESHGSQPGHLRFSEELQHQESIHSIKISV